MLTNLAKDFLKTLERRPAIPTEAVEAILKKEGYAAFAPWLEFHERYAGYVEVIAEDAAVWGLVHEKPYWLEPNMIDGDREVHEDTWYITCADVHPSYSYQLDNKGEFLGGPAESFDIHVERRALGWSFTQRSKYKLIDTDELHGESFQNLFISQIKDCLIQEASDRFIRYYISNSHLVSEDAETGKLRSGWHHI